MACLKPKVETLDEHEQNIQYIHSRHAQLQQWFQARVARSNGLLSLRNILSCIFIIIISTGFVAQVVAVLIHVECHSEPSKSAIVFQVFHHFWKDPLDVGDVVTSHQECLEDLA